MPTKKKFVGSKMDTGKYFEKLGRCDEDREVYEDSELAPFFKKIYEQ